MRERDSVSEETRLCAHSVSRYPAIGNNISTDDLTTSRHCTWSTSTGSDKSLLGIVSDSNIKRVPALFDEVLRTTIADPLLRSVYRH